jgi:hypothetical protein
VREVLRDEIDLARSLRLEQLRLAHDIVEAEGAMLSTHERDGAEGTAVVAAFADLEIPDVRQVAREQADAGMQRRRFVDQPSRLELREQPIDL